MSARLVGSISAGATTVDVLVVEQGDTGRPFVSTRIRAPGLPNVSARLGPRLVHALRDLLDAAAVQAFGPRPTREKPRDAVRVSEINSGRAGVQLWALLGESDSLAELRIVVDDRTPMLVRLGPRTLAMLVRRLDRLGRVAFRDRWRGALDDQHDDDDTGREKDTAGCGREDGTKRQRSVSR